MHARTHNDTVFAPDALPLPVPTAPARCSALLGTIPTLDLALLDTAEPEVESDVSSLPAGPAAVHVSEANRGWFRFVAEDESHRSGTIGLWTSAADRRFLVQATGSPRPTMREGAGLRGCEAMFSGERRAFEPEFV